VIDLSRNVVSRVAPSVDVLVLFPWLGIGALVWIATFLRIRGFGRLLRDGSLPSPELQARAAELAARVGLRRAPAVWMSGSPISPLVWAVGLRPRIIVPGALWQGLDPDQRDALLLHELAHIKRRDHWVRFLEIAAIGLYWWHPVVWWARRKLREAEEQCCDDWVVRLLPCRAKVYAYALLDTLDFLAKRPGLLSLGGSGLIEECQLKRRLVRILSPASAKRSHWAGSVGVLGLTTISLFTGPRLASDRYFHALDLGTLGGRSTEGIKLNALGQVVGRSEVADEGLGDPRSHEPVFHPFRTASDRPIDPRTDDLAAVLTPRVPRVELCFPSDINSSGQVALPTYSDERYSPWPQYHGFILDGVRLVDIDPDGISGGEPTATAINEAGQFVGIARRSRNLPQSRPGIAGAPWAQEQLAFRTRPGQPVDLARDDLGHLGGRDLITRLFSTQAWDVNQYGQVVGASLALDGWHHAFRTGYNQPINPATDDLGTLGGKSSDARGTNDLGQAVGSSDRGNGTSHAFRTGPNQPINPATDDLGALGGPSSHANAINNQGDVVGGTMTAEREDLAFLFTGGKMIDLNSRVTLGTGWILEDAWDINDRGQILAIAVDFRSRDPRFRPPRRTYLLTPAPDVIPPAMFFLGTAVTAAGLVLAKARRRAASPLSRLEDFRMCV
jgi:probable HAF family extracellular repeat protein